MDIDYLKRFVIVGQTLNFRKASELLYISQPALTHSINTLEKELNVTLLERNTKNVRLTELGKIFLESCLQIIAIYDDTIASITNEANRKSNILNIGYVGPALGKNLSPWIIKYREQYPDISLQVIRYRSTEIQDALADNFIQLGIVYDGFLNNNMINSEIIAIEEFKLMVNSSNPLAKYDHFSLDMISNEPMLLCNKESSPHYYNKILEFFDMANVIPNITFEAKDISEIYRLVDMGLGSAIMSVADTKYYDNYNLKFINIDGISKDKLQHRRILAWCGELTPAAKKFKQIVDDSPIIK